MTRARKCSSSASTDYWKGSPKGVPAIKKLHVRFVPDLATAVTELLAQKRGLDLEHQSRPDQQTSTRCRSSRPCDRNRCASAISRSTPPGRSGADNPLTKLKVRQAIWHAVDRKQFADKLVGGGSRVPPAPCFPSQFGCDADAAVKYDFDPAKAKALLAEAGYPQRLRRRDGELRPADLVGRGDPELSHGGRHPRQDHPAPGRAGHPEGPEGRGAAVHGKLGQLLDQRRLGDPAGDVRRRRPRQLFEGPRAREA